MKADSVKVGMAPPSLECSRCSGTGLLVTPLKKDTPKELAVYFCPVCKFSFTSDGNAVVKDPQELNELTRNCVDFVNSSPKAMTEHEKSVLLARTLQFGMQMWFDGVKHGQMMMMLSQREQTK